ncbi:DNA-directed RNA polymerase [Methanohalophilus portucalensis]|uniref:DNA-directed RNA polymerase subunit Rpo7 n=3 Tax=Methanohalophilus portucalensis TaxID=39664 RepID=A0A1X7N4Q8_9EURY|nr:DNA-directed RNA polymerase [Methanohalophilus portucalensis]ATU08621.1 DNA-directed RNA polymerase [Methanohalophilus portucalensis]RNI13207.1 DNA-directed RNA polymerase [Methanohalophilus portucalensis FDF-1]SMH32342.1 DNA-directed RNA polymerase, subunit E' [Methanohalophilus portucalensis FDF-1]
MYKRMKLVDTVRVAPSLLADDVRVSVKNALKNKLEGRVDKKIGSVVAITDIAEIGEGHILVGDGAVYYDVTFEAIMFIPTLQEVIEGEVVETVEFGAFVSIGAMDGLLHVSQITDDFMSYDGKNGRLISKNVSKALSEGDRVRARIVAVSINEREPRDSKIGLTMRQPALGKLEWLDEQRKPTVANK